MDPLLLVMLLMVGGMFLLSSRAKKQQKAATAFRSELKAGDEVMTASGFFGTVIDVDGDVVTLESPSGAQTEWHRNAIGKISPPPWGPAAEEPAEAAEDSPTDAGSQGDRPA